MYFLLIVTYSNIYCNIIKSYLSKRCINPPPNPLITIEYIGFNFSFFTINKFTAIHAAARISI